MKKFIVIDCHDNLIGIYVGKKGVEEAIFEDMRSSNWEFGDYRVHEIANSYILSQSGIIWKLEDK